MQDHIRIDRERQLAKPYYQLVNLLRAVPVKLNSSRFFLYFRVKPDKHNITYMSLGWSETSLLSLKLSIVLIITWAGGFHNKQAIFHSLFYWLGGSINS